MHLYSIKIKTFIIYKNKCNLCSLQERVDTNSRYDFRTYDSANDLDDTNSTFEESDDISRIFFGYL